MTEIINPDCKGFIVKKAITIKFYGSQRHDPLYCKGKLEQIIQAQFKNIVKFKYYIDSEKSTGIHYNGILETTNIKKWLSSYTLKSEIKDKSVFAKIDPIRNADHWLKYCLKRQKEYMIISF